MKRSNHETYSLARRIFGQLVQIACAQKNIIHVHALIARVAMCVCEQTIRSLSQSSLRLADQPRVEGLIVRSYYR